MQISAVSNLEDTHTALKQNDTIRILTYITIAYLPLSFVAVRNIPRTGILANVLGTFLDEDC